MHSERPTDADEQEPLLLSADPLPPRRDARTESLVDLVEMAYHHLRALELASPDPERAHLLAHMERILAETAGYPD